MHAKASEINPSEISPSYKVIICQQVDSIQRAFLASGLRWHTVLALALSVVFSSIAAATSSGFARELKARAEADCEKVNMAPITRLCGCRKAKVQWDPFFTSGGKPKHFKYEILEPMSVSQSVSMCVCASAGGSYIQGQQ